jgi:EmrB/QacA subfamily drug resistance transporter
MPRDGAPGEPDRIAEAAAFARADQEGAMDATTAYRRRWATLAVLTVCLLVIGLDNTILNVALPSLATSLHAADSQLQWMVDSYTLVFAGLLLTAGSVGDRFGRRIALFTGLAVFGAASVWAAWSGSAEQLIAARAVMGIGGAFIMPSTLSVLTNTFTDAAERAKAIGIWAAASGLGIVLGPTLGGWLLERFWWGSVFLVNVPIALLGILAGFWLVPESRDPAAPRIDLGGAVLSVAGLSTLVWSIIEAPQRGWTSTSVLAGFTLAVLLLAGFAWYETRVAEPMLNLGYFRDRRFAAGSVSVTLLFFALFGTIFFLSQYLQFVLDYSALEAGQRVIPVATLVLGAPIGIKLSQRFGDRAVIPAGMGLVAAALALLSTTTGDTGYGRVAIALSMIGFGMGLAMAPATEAVMGSLPKDKSGVGSAVNDTTRQIGGALGVAILGSILSSGYGDRLTSHLAEQAPGQAVPEAALGGIGGALTVAARLPGQAGAAFADTAQDAFIHGMDTAVAVGAGVAALGALLSLLLLPGRARTTAEPVSLGHPEDTMPQPEARAGAATCSPPPTSRWAARSGHRRADATPTVGLHQAHGARSAR